jgi:SNF2 family DNA or RNA helicase
VRVAERLKWLRAAARSVPTDQRGALIERFRTDPACQVLLLHDAGGVGLTCRRPTT